MSICSISTQWEKFLETFSKLTNMQENTETQKDWVLVYMLRMVFYKWPVNSGFLLFASSVCPLFLSPTHHKTLPKHFVHPPPKGARCSDIAWRKCGTDVWTQGAVALLSAWHQHTIELSKLSCTYWVSSPRSSNHFPKRDEMGPRGVEYLESRMQKLSHIVHNHEQTLALPWRWKNDFWEGAGARGGARTWSRAKTTKRVTDKFHTGHTSSSTLVTSHRCHLFLP